MTLESLLINNKSEHSFLDKHCLETIIVHIVNSDHPFNPQCLTFHHTSSFQRSFHHS